MNVHFKFYAQGRGIALWKYKIMFLGKKQDYNATMLCPKYASVLKVSPKKFLKKNPYSSNYSILSKVQNYFSNMLQAYNHGHNILGHFATLLNFLFATSKTKQLIVKNMTYTSHLTNY